MTVALIDGDELCYVIGFSVKEDEPVQHAYHLVNKKIKTITSFLHTSYYYIYLTGPNNFRKDVATFAEYKGKRKDLPKPKYHAEIRQFLVERHAAIIADNWEADDCLSLAATEQQEHIICTQDKDLRQIPGYYVNPYKLKEQGKPKVIVDGVMEEQEAEASLAVQIIKGDATDNIPSMLKWAGKKAWKGLYAAIQNHTRPVAYASEIFWSACKDTYGEEGADWALWEQMTLLTMLTDLNQYDEIQQKLRERQGVSLPWTNWRDANE